MSSGHRNPTSSSRGMSLFGLDQDTQDAFANMAHVLHATQEMISSSSSFAENMWEGCNVSPTEIDSSDSPPGIATATRPQQRKRFQQYACSYLLTFPQCSVPKSTIWERALQKWGGNIHWAVICDETHQDGSPHMHAVLHFHESMRFQSPMWADFLTKKHGNYRTIERGEKHLTRAVQYVAKAGSWELFYNGDQESDEREQILEKIEGRTKKKQKTGVWGKLVQHVTSGVTLEELARDEDMSSFIAQNFKKVRDYVDFHSCMTKPIPQSEQFAYLRSIIPRTELSEHLQYLLYWFNSGDHINNRNRPIRAKQLWVIADFGAGKTTLITRITKMLRVFFMPPHEDFYCTYDDNKFDIAVLDEFHGQKQINWLNSWLDGSHFPLKRKGACLYTKKFNIPTIIFSNFTPTICYAKAETDRPGSLAPLQDRLMVLNLTRDEIRSIELFDNSCAGTDPLDRSTIITKAK